MLYTRPAKARSRVITNWSILPVRHGIASLVLSSDRTCATPRLTIAVPQQELFRREKDGKLTAAERAALHADMQYWYDKIEVLERLEETLGCVAVNTRRPHW